MDAEYTLMDKIRMIEDEIAMEKSKNPIEIVVKFMRKQYVNIHGPEHHFLDGASFLVAYKNAGGELDLVSALDALRERTLKMPGAMCGYWGICGSVAAVGASLAIIHGTGPLSDDRYYEDHMEYTSRVISAMSKIGGPRCCKRNAFLSLLTAVSFVKEKYGIELDRPRRHLCEFWTDNCQCIKDRCPYYER